MKIYPIRYFSGLVATQQGYHLDGNNCVVNIPGPGARMDPNNPGCWYNDNNDRRCFPGVP